MEKEVLTILQRIEQSTLLAAKKMLNLDEVVLLTGLSKSYLYRLTSSGRIPHYKPSGKQIYFDRSDIEAWLRRNRVDSIEEIERAAINYVVMNKKIKG